MSHSNIYYIGFASGTDGAHIGSAQGPILYQTAQLKASPLMATQWLDMIQPTSNQNLKQQSIDLNVQLSLLTEQCVRENKPFVVIGGDHSCGIGTWSGASYALNQPMGMLWIDAHLDAHTPSTSPSGNLHGMVIAILLGEGYDHLTRLRSPDCKLDPGHLVYIGTRSFEEEEKTLLEHYGVQIFDMNAIQTLGLSTCLQRALDQISEHGKRPYGISIDLDVFDPSHAPGVSCPVPRGIDPYQLIEAWPSFSSQPIGLEIAELNPYFDQDDKTLSLIDPLISMIYDL